MDRLTKRKEDGTAYVQLYSDPDRPGDVIFEQVRKEIEVIERLARYEDLAEQGRLVELPCDVGTTVYEVYQFCGDGAWEADEHKLKLEDLPNIGKTVFVNREDAESRIAELEQMEEGGGSDETDRC